MSLPGEFCNWIKACVTTPKYSVSLNGSLVGYFKGAKGIRKGDPLSPYLFVIVMNVLSSSLDVAAKKGIFKFHPKCKRISLTHLCFADDLLVFCHGSLDAVLGVQNTLEKFYELSGLRLNALKTEFFACGLNEHELEQIRLNWFRVGQLPVRYLGVPLLTRKLTGKDCAALLSRQLILPKGIIRDIERLCMHFFWKGSDTSARGARVKVHFGLLGLMNIVLDLLPTKDRLARFGMAIDNVCEVCDIGMESRDHLFSECSYGREVWGVVLHSCGLRHEPYSWDEGFRWLIVNLKCKSLIVHILKLAWTGFVHFIWEERNHRHFRGLLRSVDTTVTPAPQKGCRSWYPLLTIAPRPLYRFLDSNSFTDFNSLMNIQANQTPPNLFFSDPVEFIASTFAYSIVQAFSCFEVQWGELCSDIKDGTLSSMITLPRIRKAVLDIMSLNPNPCLASQIEEICREYRTSNWHYVASLPLVSADYGLTEGWIGVNLVDFTSHADVVHQLGHYMIY
ncbi:hypothetical protein F3Y22_tig00110206pilonHSYRG00043 [Hibiscus syriacus]|uniref:Reverse transcriptase domain-containing protein n=1 Tax=Hibiscus syriacus TaxID=106335 RepID=A0A6A3BFL4_HIBSY|nr:hypothetical protein F3Y22_tig00110206pilonHSYRG00043 [Hibiscus syriacus]